MAVNPPKSLMVTATTLPPRAFAAGSPSLSLDVGSSGVEVHSPRIGCSRDPWPRKSGRDGLRMLRPRLPAC